jgi:hypothetical protein
MTSKQEEGSVLSIHSPRRGLERDNIRRRPVNRKINNQKKKTSPGGIPRQGKGRGGLRRNLYGRILEVG